MLTLAQKAMIDSRNLQATSIEVSSSSVSFIKRLQVIVDNLKARFLADILSNNADAQTLTTIDRFVKVRERLYNTVAAYVDTFERTTDDTLIDQSDSEATAVLDLVYRNFDAYGQIVEASQSEEGKLGVKGLVIKAIRGIGAVATTVFRVFASGVKLISKILLRVLMSPWGLALIGGATVIAGAYWLYKKITGKSEETVSSYSSMKTHTVRTSAQIRVEHPEIRTSADVVYDPSRTTRIPNQPQPPIYSQEQRAQILNKPYTPTKYAGSARYVGLVIPVDSDERKQTSTFPSYNITADTMAMRQSVQNRIGKGTTRAYAKKLANHRIIDLVIEGAHRVGVDPQMMIQIVRAESAYGTMTVSGTSRAQGIFQIVPDTWRSHYLQFKRKYGIPVNSPNDPLSASIFSAAYAKDILIPRVKKVKPDANAADLYMMYVFGPGGGTALLKDLMTNPNQATIATHSRRSYGPSQIRANKAYFYRKDGSAKTVAETYQTAVERVTMSREEEELLVNEYGRQIIGNSESCELVTYSGRIYQL